eukprot:940114-Karenia_brevis.AAC.1
MDVDEEEAKLARSEHRSGLALWHSFSNVIFLKVNVRAPGQLGDLLEEMREGPLQEASWQLLQSRRLGWHKVGKEWHPLPGSAIDQRLLHPPFSNNCIYYVVARHKLRASQAFQNAMSEAYKIREPVFVVKAFDVPRKDEAH